MHDSPATLEGSWSALLARMAGPTRPQLVYDDDCGFCTWAATVIDRWSDAEIVGFSELSADQRARLPPGYESCAHLLTPDATYSCGRAMEASLCLMVPRLDGLFRRLRRLPYYATLREQAYHLVSTHRGLLGRIRSAFQ